MHEILKAATVLNNNVLHDHRAYAPIPLEPARKFVEATGTLNDIDHGWADNALTVARIVMASHGLDTTRINTITE